MKKLSLYALGYMLSGSMGWAVDSAPDQTSRPRVSGSLKTQEAGPSSSRRSEFLKEYFEILADWSAKERDLIDFCEDLERSEQRATDILKLMESIRITFYPAEQNNRNNCNISNFFPTHTQQEIIKFCQHNAKTASETVLNIETHLRQVKEYSNRPLLWQKLLERIVADLITYRNNARASAYDADRRRKTAEGSTPNSPINDMTIERILDHFRHKLHLLKVIHKAESPNQDKIHFEIKSFLNLSCIKRMLGDDNYTPNLDELLKEFPTFERDTEARALREATELITEALSTTPSSPAKNLTQQRLQKKLEESRRQTLLKQSKKTKKDKSAKKKKSQENQAPSPSEVSSGAPSEESPMRPEPGTPLPSSTLLSDQGGVHSSDSTDTLSDRPSPSSAPQFHREDGCLVIHENRQESSFVPRPVSRPVLLRQAVEPRAGGEQPAEGQPRMSKILSALMDAVKEESSVVPRPVQQPRAVSLKPAIEPMAPGGKQPAEEQPRMSKTLSTFMDAVKEFSFDSVLTIFNQLGFTIRRPGHGGSHFSVKKTLKDGCCVIGLWKPHYSPNIGKHVIKLIQDRFIEYGFVWSEDRSDTGRSEEKKRRG